MRDSTGQDAHGRLEHEILAAYSSTGSTCYPYFKRPSYSAYRTGRGQPGMGGNLSMHGARSVSPVLG